MTPRASSIALLLLLAVHTEAGRDNQGTQFIMCFLDNHVGGTPNDVELFITTMSNMDANVNVTLPLYDPSFLETAVVQRRQTVKVPVSYGIRGSGTALEDKGIWIQSDQEIIVFAVNKEKYSTDAYQALPVDVLGMEYYVMTYVEEAQIGIVATEDFTDVTVTLPNNKYGSLSVSYNGTRYTDNDTISFTLDRFQTFHVYDDQHNADFTGAHVVGSKPIGVVGGNKKIAVPYLGSFGTSDHLTEQIPPIETLGKKFYTYSTPHRMSGDVVRIMAVNDSTTVTIGNGTIFTIDAAQFVELDIAAGDYIFIESDKGIVVGLFSKTSQSSSHGGDPAMTFLLPKPQWAADYTYATVRTPNNTEFVNQIVVHIDPTQVDGLRLDQGTVTGVRWSPIRGVSDIVVGVVEVTDGSHNIYHTDPSVVFSAISTGVAKYNSYAFATGTRMATINSVCVNSSTVAGDIVDNDCDDLIDEESLNGIDDDGDQLVDEDLAILPRVEGNWGSWSSWSNCSKSCEAIGNQTRTRNCDNPAPANNGQDCDGNSTEIISCDVTAVPCPVDGSWTMWSSWDNCTGTCGTGTQFRVRDCTNPAPRNGGKDCVGAAEEAHTCVLGVACPPLPWSSHTTALIAAGASCGAVTAIASIVACCCLLYPVARRKLSRDEEEEKLPGEEDAATGSVGLGGLTGPAAVPESAPATISITKI